MSSAIFELNLIDENVDKHTSFSLHVLAENPYLHTPFLNKSFIIYSLGLVSGIENSLIVVFFQKLGLLEKINFPNHA